MTTIVYKDGIIAYDSRLSANTLITDDDYDKHLKMGHIDFFLSGPPSGYEELIGTYLGSSQCKKTDCVLFAVERGKVYMASIDEGEFLKEEATNPSAIGSGRYHAYTAMDMGASAEEAVKMAAKRDLCTGGTIRIFNLNV